MGINNSIQLLILKYSEILKQKTSTPLSVTTINNKP